MASIDSAQKENAKAKYTLFILDYQLAIFPDQRLRIENKSFAWRSEHPDNEDTHCN